mmetsp:Transcript_70488/g.131830  ORF Transcript_70488/g.131830 Transcript_70488/m.131830 type:complete len:175 (+) Transcript_70488:61-585(+)
MALWEFDNNPADDDILAISEEGSSDDLEAVVVKDQKQAKERSLSSKRSRGKRRKRSRSNRRHSKQIAEHALAIPAQAEQKLAAQVPPGAVSTPKPAPAQGIFSLIRAPEAKEEVSTQRDSSGRPGADVPVHMLLAGSQQTQLPMNDFSTGGIEVCQLFKLGRCPRWQCRFKHVK